MAILSCCLLVAAYLSPEYGAGSADGLAVFTAAEGNALLRLTAKGALVAKVAVENPTGIASDGQTVYVTAGVGGGRLVKMSADGKVLAETAAGHSPCAPVLSADCKSAYVLGRFTAEVTEYDAATLAVKRRA